MLGQSVIKEGYLEKQSSGLVKKWQSRYFELSGHYLKYYEKKEEIKSDETIKGVVDARAMPNWSTSVHYAISQNT